MTARGRGGKVAALALAWVFASAHAQTARPTLIRDATLIDGRAQTARTGVDILLQEGRVASIRPAGMLAAPAGSMVVDGSGKIVIPGIVNLRGLVGFAQEGQPGQRHFGRGEVLAQLARYASYGVTTTASLAPDAEVLGELRARVESSGQSGLARVATPLRAVGRRVPHIAAGSPLEVLFETFRGPRRARRAVDRLARLGADFIELWIGVDGPASDSELRDSRAVIRHAVRRGLWVSVVTSRLAAARESLRAGARLLAASITDEPVDRGFASALRNSRAVYAPALFSELARFAYEGRPDWIDDRYLRRSLPPGIAGQLRGPVQVRQALDPDRALKHQRFRVALRNLNLLANQGVTIGFASGSGFPNTFAGYSDFQEAALMRRAGLTEIEIIRAFSTGSAAVLGADSGLGAIRSGSRADLVILNSDPRSNVHNLRDLHAVFVGGVLVPL